MHILFPIGSYYPSQAGGPSNSVYWLAKALTRKGQKVTVVTTNLDIPNSMCNQWLDTDAGRVHYTNTRFHRLPFKMIWTALRQVAHADVIHLTSIFYPPSLPIAIWCRLKRKKMLWSVRGELAPNALIFNSFLKKIYLKLLKRLSGSIIFHSTNPVETDQVRAVFGQQTRVAEVPNFIELPNKFERQTSSNFLLYIGRIHPIKALDNLIDALALSDPDLKGVHLKIAGRGDIEYINFLKQKTISLGISNHVEWLGEVTGEDKQQLLADAHCTLLVSHTENFGVTVTESLAQGTPVIASHGTPWQILAESRAGHWIANDPHSLAKSIVELLQYSENEYNAMRSNALRLIKERFDIHQNIHYWKEVYQQILQSN